MSSTSDTSAIDEKQQENKNLGSTNFYSNVKGFISYVIVVIILIGIYFSSSGLILYACKVAQANILPTDIHSTPYEESKINIKEIEENIFVAQTDPPSSMKIKFPFNKYNGSNQVLDMIRQYKTQSDANFLANYFISILETLINTNYNIFNKILNTVNETFSETVLIFTAPILFLIIITIIFVCNQLYLVYLWFYNMFWFFKKNMNVSGTGKPKWDDVTVLSPVYYGIAILLVILFSCIILFLGLPISFIVVLFVLLWCIFSTVTYKAEMNNTTVTAMSIVQDVFKYYKVPIMCIFSFFVIVSASSKLGTTEGIFSVIILCFIYYGIISINMFNPISEKYLSPLVSYEQAKKSSEFKQTREKQGILYGGNFGKKLEKISKNIKNISKTI
jgi:hypothetical protein